MNAVPLKKWIYTHLLDWDKSCNSIGFFCVGSYKCLERGNGRFNVANWTTPAASARNAGAAEEAEKAKYHYYY